MNISIRPWKIDDVMEVRHVIWNTWMSTYGSFIPEEDLRSFFEEHYSAEALEKQFNDADITCFLADVDGEISAYERLHYNHSEKRHYVASLYILPERQGLGIGKQLMFRAAQEAKKKKLDKVWLGVMIQNTQAVDWYKKIGYTIVEEKPFTMGATTVPHFIGYVPVKTIEAALKARISKKQKKK